MRLNSYVFDEIVGSHSLNAALMKSMKVRNFGLMNWRQIN